MNIMLRAELTTHSISCPLLGNGLNSISEPIRSSVSSRQPGNDVSATKHSIDKAMAPMLEHIISQLYRQEGFMYSRQAWKYDLGSEVLCYAKKVQIVRHTCTQSFHQRRAAATTCPGLQVDPMSAESEETHPDLQSCTKCGFAELRREVRLQFDLSYNARR